MLVLLQPPSYNWLWSSWPGKFQGLASCPCLQLKENTLLERPVQHESCRPLIAVNCVASDYICYCDEPKLLPQLPLVFICATREEQWYCHDCTAEFQAIWSDVCDDSSGNCRSASSIYSNWMKRPLRHVQTGGPCLFISFFPFLWASGNIFKGFSRLMLYFKMAAVNSLSLFSSSWVFMMNFVGIVGGH